MLKEFYLTIFAIKIIDYLIIEKNIYNVKETIDFDIINDKSAYHNQTKITLFPLRVNSPIIVLKSWVSF